MNTNSLRYFLTITEEMSFTKAADKLFMSQQALSGNIKRLEDEFGVELFTRKPVLRLTAAGEMMAFYAKEILQNEARMASSFADLSANCSGHLTIGMSRQRSNVFFPGIWKRYHPFYKNIAVSLRGLHTANSVAEIENGKLDMFVGVDVQPNHILTIVPVAIERTLCLVHEKLLKEHMPKNWKEFIKKSKNLGVNILDFQDFPFVSFLSDNRLRIVTNQIFANKNILPKIIMETAEHNLVFSLACDGTGVAVLSPVAIYDYMHGLRKVPKDCHIFYVTNNIAASQLSLVYRNDMTLPNYAEGMKNAIIQELANYSTVIQNITS